MGAPVLCGRSSQVAFGKKSTTGPPQGPNIVDDSSAALELTVGNEWDSLMGKRPLNTGALYSWPVPASLLCHFPWTYAPLAWPGPRAGKNGEKRMY